MSIDTHTKESGYAILFTIIIVGVILALATGMSNSISKQVLLSSTARDSQVAFYQADTATECGVYAEHVVGLPALLPSGSWTCAGNTLAITSTPPSGSSGMQYQLHSAPSFPGPCFNIDIMTPIAIPGTTTIEAYGYNTCDPDNRRQVERGVKLEY